MTEREVEMSARELDRPSWTIPGGRFLVAIHYLLSTTILLQCLSRSDLDQ